MPYLLDTNIVSYLMRGSSPVLDRRFLSVPKQQIAVSAICEAELRFGLEKMPVQSKVRVVTEAFLRQAQILDWDSRCAQQFATFALRQQRIGKPLAAMDGLIACHALAYDMVLVTNDAAFQNVEQLRVEDWTKGPEPA